ncbi:MAG TPA: thiamine ABC transporter substrate-binding protein [Roseiflexaceae bacterium]|mgnify:CR=1 FL=1|nr:thiamine ABC transporter substrate-binding protein [Roseiflexaceae bacterium]HMP42898.1 thiamine ABC transporter substrate-binding protein [Roseiflexaceae bacterium]
MRLRLLLLLVLLAACGAPDSSVPPTPNILTDTAPAAGRLVVMTHDSFNISAEVIEAFEAQSGATIELLPAGDTGSALNRAILSRSAPLADIFFGVDNTFLSRALDADIFTPYESPALAGVPAELRLDTSNRLLPIDYGFVTINYDRAALADAGLTPPTTLEELTSDAWRGKLIVQNPATSSPGLAFLLATIGHFGEESDYTWQAYWRDLRANDVLVTEGWEDAYYTHFSGSSGQGPRPLVVSYSTSPAAEVFFSEEPLSEPPTGNLAALNFRQIEFAGILAGTQQRALAEQFIDYMLSRPFQEDIPLQMFVYPALADATLPDVFVAHATPPQASDSVSPEQIEQNRERWINEWTTIVLR